MEMISRISKGTNMDQVYIPKNRPGFTIGSYVVIRPIEAKRAIEKPCFYNIKDIEPVKLDIINKIMSIIDKNIGSYDNIIITGSFLDRGFNFNDIDIVMISESKLDVKHIKKSIEERTGINTHIILLNNKALMRGLSTDPLYQMMLTKCVARKRFIYKTQNRIDYKILDLHLLKSKAMLDNFDILNGNEKYYLTRNMISIYLYMQHKKVNKDRVDREIERLFNIKITEIKQNTLDKNKFLKRYKSMYDETFNIIINDK